MLHDPRLVTLLVLTAARLLIFAACWHPRLGGFFAAPRAGLRPLCPAGLLAAWFNVIGMWSALAGPAGWGPPVLAAMAVCVGIGVLAVAAVPALLGRADRARAGARLATAPEPVGPDGHP